MGRAKLNLELIPKEKARNLTFRKRKEGILKKMQEFTTLCDVNACIVIYGPSGQSSEPSIWPNDRAEVERMINRYEAKVADNSTRSYGVSNFFMDRRKKLDEEVRKLNKKNLSAKYPTSLEFMDRLSNSESENLVRFLNGKLEASANRLEMINVINNEELQQQSQAVQIYQGYNHDFIDPMNNFGDNLGYVNVNPLQQAVYNHPILDDPEKNFGLLSYTNPNPNLDPNPVRMFPFMNEAEYVHFGGASSSSGGFSNNFYEPPPIYGGMNNNGGVMAQAQYYMDRQPAMAPPPPYMGCDLPQFSPCYWDMNDVKSACTLPGFSGGGVNLPPQMSAPPYYLEEKESKNNSSTLLLPAAGSVDLPQLAVPYSCTEENMQWGDGIKMGDFRF